MSMVLNVVVKLLLFATSFLFRPFSVSGVRLKILPTMWTKKAVSKYSDELHKGHRLELPPSPTLPHTHHNTTVGSLESRF